MGAIADIFAAVHLNLETGTFEVDAAKVADSAGASMSKKLKSAIVPAIGAAAGAMASLALTGGAALDSATKRAVADMGLTGKAAEDAGHSIASMYSNNLQGFDAIGAAMTKVHNDLGLTGAAADAATEKFLKFSTATGQDAAGAVASFDDILDAWNLTAADAGSIMDKLVVSHQKYGGVIAESESALSAMAPAMQAANMKIDDGIALLNLFNAAGIDASKAPMALAKAVKLLKPGQDINDLIAQIGAIEDPTLRGQKAMEIFGGRGIAMSQAFKTAGMTLDDFAVSETEATGKTNEMAEASLSWGDKATLAMHKVGGALAEFGTQFGPLLMVAATIGPKFTTALLAGLGGIGGLLVKSVIPKITGELASAAGLMPWMTTGTKIGTVMGAAIGPAMALAVPGAIIIGLEAAKPTIQKWLDDMGLKVPDLFQGQGALAPPGQIVPVGTQTTYAEGNAAAHEAAMKAAGASDAAAIAAGLASGAPKMLAASKDLGWNVLNGVRQGMQTVSVDKVFAAFGTSLKGVIGASRALGHTGGVEGMLAMAAGIESERAKPLDAFETMVEMLKHAMTPAAEAARLAGELTSKALADGLHSADPEVRAQAIAVKEAALDRLATLVHETGSIGKKAMAELDAGIHSKIPAIRSTSIAAKAAVMKELGKTAGEAGPAGKAAMAQLDEGIRSKIPAIHNAALAAKNAAVAQMNAAAGPAGAAGTAVGSAFAKHLIGAAAVKFAGFGAEVAFKTGTAVKAFALGTPYVPSDQMALVHRGEIIVPTAQSDAIRAGQATLGRGGPTYNVTVNNPEPRAAGPDIGRVLRRTAALGMA